MNSTLKRDLEEVRSWLDKPKRWTQGTMFRDNAGNTVGRRDASCACMIGAIMLATGGRGTVEARERYDAAEEAIRHAIPTKFCSIAMFNDDPETTWTDVILAVDKALGK